MRTLLLVCLAAVPAFALDPTEVTVEAWARCAKAGKCTTAGVTASEWGPAAQCNFGKPGRAVHPMNCVDVGQASAYCAWAGQHLPTDAEWEAGLGTALYPWGDELPDAARLCQRDAALGGTCPVGSFPKGATAEGLLDLSGNVAEWTSTPTCSDCTTFFHRGGAFGGSWGSAVRERFGRLRSHDEGKRRGSYLGFRCAAGAGPTVSAVNAAAAITVKVDLRVVTRADGTGNPLWTREFATRVLEEATSLAHADLHFELTSYAAVRDDELFAARKQGPLLDWLEPNATPGRLSVFISNSSTVGSAGLAPLNSAALGLRPLLVMRSRKNKGNEADVYECASILLHELGHTFGYAHDGTIDAMPWPADAWWNLSPARQRAEVLARWMELHERGAPESAREAFRCKGGAPQPDADRLFDAPTSGSNAECAQRCLSWPGCVATAQPTPAPARCFLYGEGALPNKGKGKGYKNVDVCWRK